MNYSHDSVLVITNSYILPIGINENLNRQLSVEQRQYVVIKFTKQWCQNQECVPAVDPPSAIDGGWGDWSPWSECSRSCGAGVSIMQRECDHPKPASGGKFCVGERRRYRICNTQPCPEDKPSFRAAQCTYFNNESYNGQMYTWLPYFEQSKQLVVHTVDIFSTLSVLY